MIVSYGTYNLLSIIDHQQVIPASDSKLSLDSSLVDQVINSDSFVVDPTLPSKSEVKVVESMSSPPNPTLSSESVKTEVVALTKSSSCSSLPVENELKPVEFFYAFVLIVLDKRKFCLF